MQGKGYFREAQVLYGSWEGHEAQSPEAGLKRSPEGQGNLLVCLGLFSLDFSILGKGCGDLAGRLSDISSRDQSLGNHGDQP